MKVTLVLFAVLQSANGISVGIIGGGIGGTSAAHRLSLHPEIKEIHLYEGSKRLGGRLATVTVDGMEYEAGGSIIHPDNKLMVQYAQLLGLSKREMPEEKGAETVLHDGSHALLSISEDGSMLGSLKTLGRIVRRYGLDIFRLRWHVSGIIGRFESKLRIYAMLDHESYPTVEALLGAMDPTIPPMLNRTLAEYLSEEVGLSPITIHELCRVAVHVNNAQVPNAVHSFVGAVALAGMDPDIWAVQGGNRKVPEGLIEKSRAKLHLNSLVEVIRKTRDGRWEVDYRSGDGPMETHTYDQLIVAIPLRRGAVRIKFEGVDEFVVEGAAGVFHRLYATFIQGIPRWSKWGYDDKEDVVHDIFSTNPTLPYISMSQVVPVEWKKGDPIKTGAKRVWKVFSQNKMSEALISDMFQKVVSVQSLEWYAYPDYARASQPSSRPFALAPGLHWINSIEWAASAMEMSALGAANVVANIVGTSFANKQEL